MKRDPVGQEGNIWALRMAATNNRGEDAKLAIV